MKPLAPFWKPAPLEGDNGLIFYKGKDYKLAFGLPSFKSAKRFREAIDNRDGVTQKSLYAECFVRSWGGNDPATHPVWQAIHAQWVYIERADRAKMALFRAWKGRYRWRCFSTEQNKN